MEELGKIHVSEEVFSTVTRNCLQDIEGVSLVHPPATSAFAKLFLREGAPLDISVQVNTDEPTVAVDLSLLIDYGKSITRSVEMVQRSVKETIEKMTGYTVTAVNVHITGLKMPGEETAEAQQDEDKPSEEEPEEKPKKK